MAGACKLRITRITLKFFLRTDLEKHHHIPGIQIKKTKKHELFIHLCLCISKGVMEQMPAEDTQFFWESLGSHAQLLPTERKESNSRSSGASKSQVWTSGKSDGNIFPDWHSPGQLLSKTQCLQPHIPKDAKLPVTFVNLCFERVQKIKFCGNLKKEVPFTNRLVLDKS